MFDVWSKYKPNSKKFHLIHFFNHPLTPSPEKKFWIRHCLSHRNLEHLTVIPHFKCFFITYLTIIKYDFEIILTVYIYNNIMYNRIPITLIYIYYTYILYHKLQSLQSVYTAGRNLWCVNTHIIIIVDRIICVINTSGNVSVRLLLFF